MGPDPAVAATRLAVRRLGLAPGTVVVAVSGGADSLALLAATLFEAREGGWNVVGATVDHGLQDGSAEHAASVVKQMGALGVQETLTATVTVEPNGQGIEAAAREARYAVLGEVAERFSAQAVLLGHTLDDQAETVLMGLTRGSGGRSIAGMRRAFGVYRRPFLDVTRAQTEAACRAEGIEWWTDPHNSDPRFLRSRVRHTVMPVLEAQLGPGVAQTLAGTGDLLREDLESLDQIAEDSMVGSAALKKLRGFPPAIRSRVLRMAALEAGAPASELFRVHVDALTDLVLDPRGREVQLPGLVTAYCDGDSLRFRKTLVTE
ncbi:MAG TPA: tRNA lysidine(34) synthetase TilS [Nocardioidaceae bacterium]|nr:tRNA lysidine(34) synthetase TilS [Nocardioidaceae bacterium]